ASTIGGTAAGEGNVIAGGGGTPLSFDNAGGSGRTYHDGLVRGNKIGVNAAGTATTYTNGPCVLIAGWTNLTIGGTAAGAANIIGEANVGILLGSSPGVLIQGNFIGTDQTRSLNFRDKEYGIAVGGLP